MRARRQGLSAEPACLNLRAGRTGMGKAIAIVAGLLIAALAEYIAMLVGGAGHGWIAPLRYSPILFLLYPLALFRRLDEGGTTIMFDRAMLVVGVIASLLLLVDTVANESDYFPNLLNPYGLVVLFWMFLWVGWLIPTAMRMVRRHQSNQVE